MTLDFSGDLESRLTARCNQDGEFRLAARYWDGSFAIDFGEVALQFALNRGTLLAGHSRSQSEPGRRIALKAGPDVWERLLAPVPPPLFNDIMPAAALGLVIDAEPETLWQYYPAVRRLVDLLREEVHGDATVR